MTVDRTAVTLSIDDMRLRFRTTLEIDVDRSAVAHEKVPVFWEDQLFGERRTERRALPHW